LLAGSLLLIAAATWSVVTAWRSGGRRDHRVLVDRVVLGVLGVVALGGLLGLGLLIGGSRPVDPLHLVYGPASVIALPVAIWLGARGSRTQGSRLRRDLWTAGGGVVLVGLGLRLFATG
jgi:uncharacterized membrane protein YqgA involved in biofilm formation